MKVNDSRLVPMLWLMRPVNFVALNLMLKDFVKSCSVRANHAKESHLTWQVLVLIIDSAFCSVLP